MIRPSNTDTPAVAAPESPLREYCAALLASLRGATPSGSGPVRSVGVTSCTRGEGVTTISTHLARHAASDLGEKTLLIDLSPNQRSVVELLGGHVSPGFSDCLVGEVNESDSVRPTDVPNLHALATGSKGNQFAVDSERINGLLDRLKSRYALVVTDLPTASELSGCYAVAAALDGIVLIVEAERIRSEVVRRAKEKLVQARANILGVVLNKRRQHVPEWLYRRI